MGRDKNEKNEKKWGNKIKMEKWEEEEKNCYRETVLESGKNFKLKVWEIVL